MIITANINKVKFSSPVALISYKSLKENCHFWISFHVSVCLQSPNWCGIPELTVTTPIKITSMDTVFYSDGCSFMYSACLDSHSILHWQDSYYCHHLMEGKLKIKKNTGLRPQIYFYIQSGRVFDIYYVTPVSFGPDSDPYQFSHWITAASS